MSRASRSPRVKSSSGHIRPLGSIHLAHGAVNQSTSRNDPALLINQLHLASNNNNSIDKERELLREKEFKEKEKKLLDQISALEKLIAQLRQQLKEKSLKCSKLEEDMTLQAKEYEQKLSESFEVQTKLKQECENAKALAEERNILLQKTTQDYEEKIKSIVKEYEEKLASLRDEKDRELREKDAKMDVLKQRMAASLGKNSQERQQQLEELRKDLVKHAQEARDLQHKLRHLQHKSCENCKKLQDKLEEKTLQLRLKEKSINDLQNIGKKMQVQLLQQEMLIDKWEERANGN